jgi:hypothetical protein
MSLLTSPLLLSTLLTLLAMTVWIDDFQFSNPYSKIDGPSETMETVLQTKTPKHRGSGRRELARYDA